MNLVCAGRIVKELVGTPETTVREAGGGVAAPSLFAP